MNFIKVKTSCGPRLVHLDKVTEISEDYRDKSATIHFENGDFVGTNETFDQLANLLSASTVGVENDNI